MSEITVDSPSGAFLIRGIQYVENGEREVKDFCEKYVSGIQEVVVDHTYITIRLENNESCQVGHSFLNEVITSSVELSLFPDHWLVVDDFGCPFVLGEECSVEELDYE